MLLLLTLLHFPSLAHLRPDPASLSICLKVMKTFKHIEKLEQLYDKHPHMHNIDSTINILLYLFCHLSIHLSIHLISDAFQSKVLLATICFNIVLNCIIL